MLVSGSVRFKIPPFLVPESFGEMYPLQLTLRKQSEGEFPLNMISYLWYLFDESTGFYIIFNCVCFSGNILV